MAQPISNKNVGGAIPEELYWKFKAAQVARHESSTKALENAIRLYVDMGPQGDDSIREEEEEENG